ncbi:carboxypeptidase-like regulatory domain-containing protein, partial [Sphingobacterium sp. IITKGP-BTPF85]
MKKVLLLNLILYLCMSGTVLAQSLIKGSIKNSTTNEAAYAISIRVKNGTDGTYSDDRGRFQLKTSKSLPITLLISSIGYEPQEFIVESFSTPLELLLKPAQILGQEVVVSASRTVQNKLSSPVTIEQISAKDVVNSPQLNYMDMMQGLK